MAIQVHEHLPMELQHSPSSGRMKVLAHVDLDAFYTQVEARANPDIRGKPLVVVQYNPFGDLSTLRPEDPRIFPDSNGSIIAVSYEARAHGVKRNMMAQQAKSACPELIIVQVPVAHGKADLTIYRDAGAEVMTILSGLSTCERASIDEAYLDLTEEAAKRVAAAGAVGVHLTGWHLAGEDEEGALESWWHRPEAAWSPEDKLLAAGAVVVAELRAAVKQQLGYSCSAGIAHYKVMAKLASGLHKPSQQTLVPASAVPLLLGPLPISKLRQLGGKFGEKLMSSLGIATVGELAAVPLPRLEAAVGNEAAAWLSKLSRGVDEEEVKQRMLPKSCSCGKTFRGAKALRSLPEVQHWLLQLGQELEERLAAERASNQRLPHLLTVSVDALGAATAAAGAAAGAGAGDGRQGRNQKGGRGMQHAPNPRGGGGGGSSSAGPSSPAATATTVTTSDATTAAASPSARATPANWRAGVQSSSRSAPLGRPLAGSMANTALGLVRRWAADRGPGWRVVGLFLGASNFMEAPTGASTLERFLQSQPQPQQQEQQEQAEAVEQGPQQKQNSSLGRGCAQGGDTSSVAGRARAASSGWGGGPSGKRAKLDRGQESLQGWESTRRQQQHQEGPQQQHQQREVFGEVEMSEVTDTKAGVEDGKHVSDGVEGMVEEEGAVAVTGGRSGPGVAKGGALTSQVVQEPKDRQQQLQQPLDGPAGLGVDWQEKEEEDEQELSVHMGAAASPLHPGGVEGPSSSGGMVASLQGWLGSTQSQQQQQQQQQSREELTGVGMNQAAAVPELHPPAQVGVQVGAAVDQVRGHDYVQAGSLAAVMGGVIAGASGPHHHQQHHQQQQQQQHHHHQQRRQHQAPFGEAVGAAERGDGLHRQCGGSWQDQKQQQQQQQEGENHQDALLQQAAGAPWSAWRMTDIDPEVLSELPFEIQQEVRRALGQSSGGSGAAGSGARGSAGRSASRGRGRAAARLARGGRGPRSGTQGVVGAEGQRGIGQYFSPHQPAKRAG